MIHDFKLENYGPIVSAQGQGLGKINLILGENSTGKTFLLKALYSAIRSHEEANKGNSYQDFAEVLSEKLYWTFQVDKIGDIVTKGDSKRLMTCISLADNSSLMFGFGKDTTKKVSPTHNNLSQRSSNSVFLPPKEVLSLMDVIYKTTEIDKIFGFDATYSDLVAALKIPTQRGRNHSAFADSRQRLENVFSGKVEFDGKSNSWVYKKGNTKFSIMAAAEGVKKIAILDTLLGNRFLDRDSIVFIDEPESALHPTAIIELLDIISVLAQAGIQFFLATHSYYVIKKLVLIAQAHQMPIPTFMANATDGTWQQSCLLKDGLPDNEIINESVRLFEAEFEGVQSV
ncbi:ATP-binding protein [Pseudoalteromonas rubra]|uniref:ATPase n=1 Tax=Pseudoalteromonas rubra TaxID=43658 RepID=A0A0F4QNV1_9GAMM|nr:ATP-binding protein [Pseudoalteromonas rubra]KJZ08984.1 ATPase [Pseudoalteromonas rubra]